MSIGLMVAKRKLESVLDSIEEKKRSKKEEAEEQANKERAVLLEEFTEHLKKAIEEGKNSFKIGIEFDKIIDCLRNSYNDTLIVNSVLEKARTSTYPTIIAYNIIIKM